MKHTRLLTNFSSLWQCLFVIDYFTGNGLSYFEPWEWNGNAPLSYEDQVRFLFSICLFMMTVLGTERSNTCARSLFTNMCEHSGQVKFYEAFFATFMPKPWNLGVMLWHYELDPSAGQNGPTLIGYTPQNKPAVEVLRKYYKTYCPWMGSNGTLTTTQWRDKFHNLLDNIITRKSRLSKAQIDVIKYASLLILSYCAYKLCKYIVIVTVWRQIDHGAFEKTWIKVFFS